MMKLASLFAFLLLCVGSLSPANTILRPPDPAAPLAERWNWARAEAPRQVRGQYWIAWTVQRQMKETEIVGSVYSDRARITLKEILNGVAEPQPSLQEEAKSALERMSSSEKKAAQMVTRDLAILIKISPGGEATTSGVSLTNLHFDTGGLPIAWLGKAEQQESLALVVKIYDQVRTSECKQELIAAAALHSLPDQVIPFLQKLFTEEKPDQLRGQAGFWLANQDNPAALKTLLNQLPKEHSGEVIDEAMAGIHSTESPTAVDIFAQLASQGNPHLLREQAIFWLGQTESDRAAKLLQHVIAEDPDRELRKKAVFSLSQMPEALSLSPMIQLARGNAPEEIRKEAVFWLSQIASKKVASILKDTVENDGSFEIQKQALFALSEIEDSSGLEELIHIATTSSNAALRKEAIFCLGQSSDPRAREALLKMLEE
ncbi:MAG TPA: HEAT repeat domain-containing protein [Acidobacteriota bacterium]|nr:HEAT repeat domain-containing protein [Acidobacteriota bacterium]